MREVFKRMVSDSKGTPSSMRLLFLWFGMSFATALVVVWTYVSLYNRVVSEIPMGVIGIVGTLLAGKSAQKGIEVWGEKKEPPKEIT